MLFEPRFLRVDGNVIAKSRQLCGVTNDVVVGLVHPKGAFVFKQPVASVRAHPLRSRFERSEIVAVYWGYHRMDMVWHENKCIDIAARPVEVEQAMLDFPAHVRPPQLGGRPYRHPTIPVYGG